MKRGKKYVEAAKTIDRGTLYDVADAVSLVKKRLQQQNLMRQSRLISEQDVTDVTLTSRFVEQLFCHTEQVKRFVSLYLLKTLKLRKLKLLEQIS